jgi:hypothetical protein
LTQAQLDQEVASVTGESLQTIRTRGFGLVSENLDDLEPEDLQLQLTCPFCRAQVPYPGGSCDGSTPLAECDHCDLEFPFKLDEVHAASTALAPAVAGDRF